MSYRYILIPGRHHLITRFQTEHIQELLATNPGAEVVWAVTSANHEGTRRNPIPGTRRIGMIEAVATGSAIPSLVYGINNMSPKPNFAHFLIEEIRLESKGRIELLPDNTLVLCSTQGVAEQYRALGFVIDPAEADESFEQLHARLPWDVVEEIIRDKTTWRTDETIHSDLNPVCLAYYERYGLGDDIIAIFEDPLIDNDDGDITTTRDYASYRQAFEDGARRKVADFQTFVRPGRILDVGCATGETIKLLSQSPTLFESDFYGVEAARPLYQICQQRKEGGEFGDANVFFYQRNIMQSSLFAPDSLDTIITMALTHEIESYLGRGELEAFVRRMYDITAPGGVYINYDVVAPDGKDRIVHALLSDSDGDNPDDVFPDCPADELAGFLGSLSSKARFRRFVRDFRAAEGDTISASFESIDGQEYAVLRYADLCDFLAKKDYLTSWTSEMHERFCFWGYQDWTDALTNAGFSIGTGSRKIQNDWLIQNRFAPAAAVYEKIDGALHVVDPPVTNMLLLAYKPH